jgi:hypothetical protein
MFGKRPKSVLKNYNTLEKALELAAYRCDFDTFCEFIEKVEYAIVNSLDTELLEKEILNAIEQPRSKAFNISKIANDPTINVKDERTAS